MATWGKVTEKYLVCSLKHFGRWGLAAPLCPPEACLLFPLTESFSPRHGRSASFIHPAALTGVAGAQLLTQRCVWLRVSPTKALVKCFALTSPWCWGYWRQVSTAGLHNKRAGGVWSERGT